MLFRIMCLAFVGLSIAKIAFDGTLNGSAAVGIQAIGAVFEKLH
jgi:hypothetical protein